MKNEDFVNWVVEQRLIMFPDIFALDEQEILKEIENVLSNEIEKDVLYNVKTKINLIFDKFKQIEITVYKRGFMDGLRLYMM